MLQASKIRGEGQQNFFYRQSNTPPCSNQKVQIFCKLTFSNDFIFLFVLQFSKKIHVWQLYSFQRFSDAFHYFSNEEAERTRISSKTLHTSLKRFLNEIFIRWFHEFSVTMNLQFFCKIEFIYLLSIS